MNIIYKETRNLNIMELEELFLSVEWSSGHYPEKLAIAMQNSSTVYTAWAEDKLIGLINVLDDSIMTAYIHYLLVNPKFQGQGIGRNLINYIKTKYKDYLRILLVAYENETSFYQNVGFKVGDGKVPMFITSLWT
ncbi:MAG: GNAT family N-acetyltransferase [Bacteroidales bacterium]|jgi:GNAT superfamily N-acetyltransferase